MSEGHIDRLNAALEGRYHIERQLGEGGMATVYLADDLRHERKVALKVLKPELAAVVGAERFLAEIKTTANLQHPHILPLFDSGEADSFLFYVMPYVEGESLRERLDREHQLPVDEAVQIAKNVAEALEYAHSHGVIHRDIKPANILLQAGKSVVSDFGIALAVGVAGGGRLTETGLSLGTPHYMSPEQATGDLSVAAATDIYALGSVLYEMLVGEPPYTGTTAQAILGKIIQGLPVSATAARKSVPGNVDAAIRKALEKLPADRFADAQGFVSALTDTGFRYGVGEALGTGAAGTPGSWKMLATSAGSVAILALIVAAWSMGRSGEPPRVSRLEISTAEGLPPAPELGVNVAISPDGSTVAYVGMAPDGGSQIWQRPLDELSPLAIPGTEGGLEPRFSPDGQAIVFAVGGGLVTVSLAGAPPQVIVTDSVEGGEVWASDGMVYYTRTGGGIWRVPAIGGEAEEVTVLGPEETEHAWLDALPDASALIFTRRSSGGRNVVSVLSLDTGEITELFTGTVARFASSGHVVFVAEDGTLMAAPFDVDELEATGPPRALLEGVWVNPTVSSQFALSTRGDLVYLPAIFGLAPGAGGSAEFVWVSRSGEATPVDADWRFDPPAGNFGWRLSPDGARLAVSTPTDGNVDIWIKQLPDGPFERLTFDDDVETSPGWTPDGTRIMYSKGARSGAAFGLWETRADGAEVPTPLFDDDNGPSLLQARWSPNGDWIVARTASQAPAIGARDIVGLRPGTAAEPAALVASPEFMELDPSLSRDGRWLAYTSDESGRREIYVRPFPEVESARVQVSISGGTHPVWAKSGDELFFIALDGAIVSARFQAAPEFRVLQRETLFGLGGGGYFGGGGVGSDPYDVAPNDQRFIVLRAIVRPQTGGQDMPRFVLVQNFVEELERLVPAD